MGCELSKILRIGSQLSRRQSKSSNGDGEPDGKVLLPDPPSPAPVDPRLPLSARQKFSAIKSWKGISRTMQGTGVFMFIKLFEDHKELLTLFQKFHDLTDRDSQYESVELAEHAQLVMVTLDDAMKALDDMDFFEDFLKQTGRTHHKVPGFKKDYFWKIKEPFLYSVKNTLGDRYTENIEHIYTVMISFIIETLVKGYDMGPQNTAPSDDSPD